MVSGATVAKCVAALCGVSAVLLLALYIGLQVYIARRKRASRAARGRAQAARKAEGAAPQDGKTPGSREGQPHRPPSSAQGGAAKGGRPPMRDPDVVRREQELKRDTLHVFRRMQAATSKEEKCGLCAEAVALFDAIESRVGSGMSLITSGRIIFCNALMECGGLDALRDCQDANDPDATALIERAVPIIFST
mmetsp:Transcript_66570/g.187492  ORF Transcript_66570/g.187492 Transcript_66570/m.187492 type:complete len:193 (+) Transcript_66570:212-790(+)